MKYMFQGAAAFNQDIGQWNVSQVTDMEYMFQGAAAFNQDIGQWNVSSVQDMKYMFQNAVAFNQDIGEWDVSQVTDMRSMFDGATSFNANIGNWDVSQVIYMSYMFYYASAFNKNITLWNPVSVSNFSYMFAESKIIDEEPTFGFTPTPVYTQFNQIFVPADKSALQTAVNKWYEIADGTNDGGYSSPLEYANYYYGDEYNGNPNTWDVSGITDMSSLFINKTQNNHPDISTWNTSSVTNMEYMFLDALAFNQNINTKEVTVNGTTYTAWDVSKVTKMVFMFCRASAFNQDIGQWNVSSVQDMKYIFQGAAAFNQDISLWNVSSVKNMQYMFSGAAAFNQPIGNWNTSKVEDMQSMFQGAAAFNQDIGQWNVSSVQDMKYMFQGAAAFNQNINIWNVNQYKSDGTTPTELTYMFDNMPIKTGNPYGFSVPTPTYDEFNVTFFIKGANPAIVKKGSTYTDAGVIAAHNLTNLTTTSNVNTSIVGTYSVIYSGTKGVETVTATRTVFVQEVYIFTTKTQLQTAINKWYENAAISLDVANNYNGIEYFGNPNTWDVTVITDMSFLFKGKVGNNHPEIGTWNTCHVTTMESMFEESSFNKDIGGWNVHNVENFQAMFKNNTYFDNAGSDSIDEWTTYWTHKNRC
jgi:surface protein